MKENIRQKLDQIIALKVRLQGQQLSEENVVADMQKFQRLSKELHQVEPIAAAYESYLSCQDALADAQAFVADAGSDEEMVAMAEEEGVDLDRSCCRY